MTRRFPRLLEPMTRPSPDASSLFVVRPDGYFGLSTGEAAWDDAERYLKALVKDDGRTRGHAS